MAGPQTRDRATEAVDLALASDAEGAEGKRRALLLAEEARDEFSADDSFAGSLFLGRAPWALIHPFPAPPAADLAKGDAFLAKLTAVLRESVDAEKVDRTGEIPEKAIEALRGIGAFGIKIPAEFGGLGLRQWDYTRAAMLLGIVQGMNQMRPIAGEPVRLGRGHVFVSTDVLNSTTFSRLKLRKDKESRRAGKSAQWNSCFPAFLIHFDFEGKLRAPSSAAYG